MDLVYRDGNQMPTQPEFTETSREAAISAEMQKAVDRLR
jgi:hypothetical protein